MADQLGAVSLLDRGIEGIHIDVQNHRGILRDPVTLCPSLPSLRIQRLHDIIKEFAMPEYVVPKIEHGLGVENGVREPFD